MLKDLPSLIEPSLLAFQGCRLKGRVALTQMKRLCNSLCDVRGDVYIDWLFATDDKQRPIIEGSMQTQLSILCQRCLQPMHWPIDTKTALIILNKEPNQDDKLPVKYEVLTLTSTQVQLITIIEDELILALPIVAKHTVCPSNEYQLPDSLAEHNTFSNNPFHVLSQLKIENQGKDKKLD